MSTELKQERTEYVINAKRTPISSELKSKVNIAFKDIVDRFKNTVLS